MSERQYNNLVIPNEVIGDILQYMNCERLDELADYSKQARYIVNGMDRRKYIYKWFDKYTFMDGLTLVGECDMEHILNNYWYMPIILRDDSYPILLKTMVKVKSRWLYLDFRDTSISDEDISTGVLANIIAINFCGCENITDISLINGSLANVKMLELYNCNNITNRGIKLNRLYNIEALYLGGCKNITDVSTLTNVHTLNLEGCDITDVGISGLSSVYNIYLSYCKNMTSDGLSVLSNAYKVHIYGCNKITTIGVLGNVHILDLEFCDNIKDICVRTLGNVYVLELRFVPIEDEAHLALDYITNVTVHKS